MRMAKSAQLWLACPSAYVFVIEWYRSLAPESSQVVKS